MATYNNDLALIVRYDGTKEAFNNELTTNLDKYKNKVVFIYGAADIQGTSENLLQAIWISDASGGRYIDTASFEYISKNLDRISTVKIEDTSLVAGGASTLSMRAKQNGGISIEPVTNSGETHIEFSVVKKADLDDNNKILTSQLPDFILGQVMFGGIVTAIGTSTATIKPSDAFSGRFGKDATTIANTETVWKKYAGVYFISNVAGVFASKDIQKGDWIISTGNAWEKIDNTDAVASVAGLGGSITAQQLVSKLSDSSLEQYLFIKPKEGITFNDLSEEVNEVLRNANNAIPSIEGDGTYITADKKNDGGVIISAKTAALSGSTNALATTIDIKNYLDAVLSVKVIQSTN